jgi:hypothetical protein
LEEEYLRHYDSIFLSGTCCDERIFVIASPVFPTLKERIMKNLASLLLISASLTATVALAQDNNGSSLTRAQVATELQAAKAAGQVSSGELDYPPTTSRASTLTRSQVTAELQVAKARGQVSFGELEFPLSTSTASSMSREQVRNAAVAAHEKGSYTFGELDYQASYIPIDPSRC